MIDDVVSDMSDGYAPGPDDLVWVAGTDYVAGWREARAAARGLLRVLTAAGITDVHAVGSTDGAGRPVVCLRASAAAVARMTGAIEGSAA
jgi:hypothetical protein